LNVDARLLGSVEIRALGWPALALWSFSGLPRAEAAKVLGAGETLSIDLVSKALIGIIIFTIGYEFSTEHLENKLFGTPYLKIVNQVYKELTVMGLISFVVFMIGQVGDLFADNPDVYMAFEYAHILVFFIALMIIISSAYLCMLNYLTSVAYLNTDLATMPDLLESYEETQKTWWGRFSFHNFYAPSKLRTDFEFKILHHFFVTSYHVPRNFDFGMYLCESLDLQIVELVEVDVMSWFGVMVLILGNMLRIHLFPGDGDGDDGGGGGDASGAHRLLGSSDYSPEVVDCSNYTSTTSHFYRRLGSSSASVEDPCAPVVIDSVEIFSVFGWCMLGLSLCLMFGAHSAFMKLMAKAGCKSSLEYQKRLQHLSKKTSKVPFTVKGMRRRGISGRTLAIPKVKHKLRHHNNSNPKIAEKLGFNPFSRFGGGRKTRKDSRSTGAKVYADEGPVSSAFSDLESVRRDTSGDAGGRRMSMAQLKEFVDGRVSAQHEGKGGHRRPSVHGAGLAYTHPEKQDLARPRMGRGKGSQDPIKEETNPGFIQPQLSSHYRKETVTMGMYSEKIKAQITKARMGETGSIGEDSSNSLWPAGQDTNRSIQPMRSFTVNKGGHNVASGQQMKLQLDLKDIYWFGWASAFSRAVDFLLLILCAYVAMLATNFGPLVMNSDDEGMKAWYLLEMAFPAIFTIYPLTKTINIVCKLKAVSVLDIEVVAKILEEHEEAEKVKGVVVKKFQEQMKATGLVGRRALLDLFRKVDTDNSGYIDGIEFKTMLNMQQIFFTNKMFLHLFHVFDENNDNQISFEELEKVCFSGTDVDLTADDSRESEGLSNTKAGFKPRGITALVKQSSANGAGMGIVADSEASAFLRQRHSLLKATLDNVKRSSGKVGEGEEGEGGREFRVTEKALNDALTQMMSAVTDWALEEGDEKGGDDNDDGAGNLGFLSVEDVEDDLYPPNQER